MGAVTIIGSGMAGYSLAREFRKLDPGTPLRIITGDDGGFYAKPMLSNALALGKQAAQLLSQNAAQMAEQLHATVVTHASVSQIDRAHKLVRTSAGDFNYGQLVLALGAQPIRLAIAGNGASQVLSVNNIADYTRLRERIAANPNKSRITILGAGLIGCEFADDLAGAGHLVTLVDPNPLPLAALAPPPISLALQMALARRGVAFQLGSSASSIDLLPDHPDVLQVRLANGQIVLADIILSAVGLRPDCRLAQAANLATDRGILVDTYGRSSTPDIYALGDCAQYTLPEDGSRPVLPYIAPLMAAARAIALSLSGQLTPIALKPSAVIVKTPSCPIALIAPAPDIAANGHWQHIHNAGVDICRFFDAVGTMKGFAVAPQDAKLRTALLAEMPALARIAA